MDFKFKGIGWVGGIYQKFETLCNEVDNIVNQETVKFVENQAQSVGKSMKRLYSDVVNDILPPLKHEGQELASGRSAKVDAHVKSKAAIEEEQIDTVGKIDVEPVAVDPIEKQLDHASDELCLSDHLITPNSVDAHEDAESHIMSGQVSDGLENTSSHVNIEENAVMEYKSASELLELISPSEEESMEASLGNEAIDCNNINSCGIVGEVSLTTSIHDMEFQSTQKEVIVNNNIAVDVVNKQFDCAFGELCPVDQLDNLNSVESFSRTEYVTSEQVADVLKDTKPEVNIEENDKMEKSLVSDVSELISPAEKEPFAASLLNELTDCNDKEPCCVQAEFPSSTSVHDVMKPSASDVLELIPPVEKESFGVHEFVNCNDSNSCGVRADVSPATSVCGGQDVRIVENDLADDSEFVSDASGGITSSKVICPEENMEEVGVDSACASVLKELPENSPGNFHAEALLNRDPVNVAGLVSHDVHSSSMLTPPLSEEKLTGAVSISSSNDLSVGTLENDASRSVNGIKYLAEISGNEHVCVGESTQLQALDPSDIGPINDTTDDIRISSMETIELSDEGKLEDSCVIIDSAALCAVSRIMRKHRSYRKRIQDALTSKKKLAKEYEQLAIWFGDAYMGSNQDFSQTLRPSSSTTPLECKNLQTELVSDSEWELL